jgi:hypothetical protein
MKPREIAADLGLLSRARNVSAVLSLLRSCNYELRNYGDRRHRDTSSGTRRPAAIVA